jgi:hypothetical protein
MFYVLVRTYAVMHVNELATDHVEEKCVIFYKPSNCTESDFMSFPKTTQRHYVRTPQGLECRVCEVHGHNDCAAKCTFCIAVGGRLCECDPTCIIVASHGGMGYTCSNHAIGEACFALANYKPQPQPTQSKPAKPFLTTPTATDFITTFSGRLYDQEEVCKILFALDHYHTTNHKSVGLLCADVWERFRKSGENFEEFIYAEITPMFCGFMLQVEGQCRLTNLWHRVERKDAQCHIDKCPCRLIES